MNLKCKCGSTNLFFEVNNNNQTGIYCAKCGKWIKWASKEEIRIINNKNGIEKYLPPQSENSIEERLQKFISFLDGEIDRQLCREKKSPEDNIQACVYAHAYEKCRQSLINILNDKNYNED